jgi:hypothetical protein
MGKATYKSKLVAEPNTWHENEFGNIWEYGNYKNCYLCVRKTDDGKYLPTVNGSPNVRIDNWSFHNNEPLLFDRLEDAQQHLFKYMDHVRAEEAAKYNPAYLQSVLSRYVENRKSDTEQP